MASVFSVQKDFTLILTLILAFSCTSLLIIRPVSAESVPAPTVPQFTLSYVKASYNSIDPYTGVSQQVDNSTIEVIITNQPFNIIYDATNNITTSLYYNVQFKGHYTSNWTEAFNSINYSYPASENVYTWYDYPIQSNSSYTTISLPANYSADSKIDIRAQAVVANQTQIIIPNFIPNPIRGGDYLRETVMFIVQTSDWSSTQTISIHDGGVFDSSSPPDSTSSPTSQDPTATPSQPIVGVGVFGLGWFGVAALVFVGVVVVLLVAVLVFWRKRARKPV
jgi:hypothetical protein